MENRLSVPLVRLDSGLDIPAYAYAGDAGVDLRAREDVLLRPFERALVPCGLALAIPDGYAGFVLPRSGLAAKHGISVLNAPGLIDSNYRGEIKVVLINLNKSEDFAVKRGDRIAQLVIMGVAGVQFMCCEEFSETERGAGGFGSSGV